MERIKRKLTLLEVHQFPDGKKASYFFQDGYGNIYCWCTSSIKAWDWYITEKQTKRFCRFSVGTRWNHSKYGAITTIANVRFN